MNAGNTLGASTIAELLERRAALTPDETAFTLLGSAEHRVTWAQHALTARAVASSLQNAGIERGDRVGILAPNCIAWEHAQMGALACGAIVVGIDPHYPDGVLAGVLRQVRLAALFVADAAVLTRVPREIRSGLKLTATLSGAPDESSCRTLDELVLAGVLLEPTPPTGNDGAIIIFSSGTTGSPKPIVYKHTQVLVAVAALLEAYPEFGKGCRLLCWLPLANLFQRLINLCAIANGATTYMIGDPRTVMDYVAQAAPHLLIGVPRFYEKLHSGVEARIAALPRPASALSRWALRTARRGRRTGLRYALADRLVLQRLRAIFGDNMRYLISGSAPLPRWLVDWFEAIGLPVFEAYGISENIVPISMNRPGAYRAGTVGKPLAPNEVRIAPDGEIEVRGPGVFQGYGIDSERSHNEIEAEIDGFWRSGDLGAFDEDGFLRITGRKNELFKTSTGRWVSPAEIEACLRRIWYVDHAVALGAGRKTVIAVLCVQPSAHTASIEMDIATVMQDIAAYQRPAGVLITRQSVTIEGGGLTTNLKLRRKAVETKYEEALGKLFDAVELRKAGDEFIIHEL
ncbi:MAG TPA: AMP-binding protein [Nitrospirales bacterium]